MACPELRQDLHNAKVCRGTLYPCPLLRQIFPSASRLLPMVGLPLSSSSCTAMSLLYKCTTLL